MFRSMDVDSRPFRFFVRSLSTFGAPWSFVFERATARDAMAALGTWSRPQTAELLRVGTELLDPQASDWLLDPHGAAPHRVACPNWRMETTGWALPETGVAFWETCPHAQWLLLAIADAPLETLVRGTCAVAHRALASTRAAIPPDEVALAESALAHAEAWARGEVSADAVEHAADAVCARTDLRELAARATPRVTTLYSIYAATLLAVARSPMTVAMQVQHATHPFPEVSPSTAQIAFLCDAADAVRASIPLAVALRYLRADPPPGLLALAQWEADCARP